MSLGAMGVFIILILFLVLIQSTAVQRKPILKEKVGATQEKIHLLKKEIESKGRVKQPKLLEKIVEDKELRSLFQEVLKQKL